MGQSNHPPLPVEYKVERSIAANLLEWTLKRRAAEGWQKDTIIFDPFHGHEVVFVRELQK